VLPPGLWAMSIAERPGKDGAVDYEVSFEERRLEDVVARLNRFDRGDEKPFQAVAAISEFNQRAYELFLQPLVQSASNEYSAKLGRQFHPLRSQRWALSDLNPWMAWLAPAAAMVRAQRKPAANGNPLTKVEKAASTALSASLDYYRAMRDATSEAAFFQIYGNVFSLYVADKQAAEDRSAPMVEARDLPFVQEALASIREGGYPEALARVACLLARKGEPLLLSKLQMKQAIMADYKGLLPDMPMSDWRRVRGEQEIIVRYAPDEALATLPSLLADPDDRRRLVTLVKRLLGDERVRRAAPNGEQIAMAESIGAALDVAAVTAPPRRKAAPRKRAAPKGARRRG